MNANTTQPVTSDEYATKLAADTAGAACAAIGNAGGYPTGYPYDYTAERKLQIFHTILQQRHDLSPVDAATAAEAVFKKLCIPQAPTMPA